jgi:acetyl esterase
MPVPSGPALDPQARALLDLMIERQVPAVHTLAPDEARRLYRERRHFTQPDPPPVGEVRALNVPGPAGDIPCRLYAPQARGAGLLPVLLYFHGGGWVIGDLDTHDVLCRQLCEGAGVAVLSVDYRLAPEHRFPAAVDDCAAVVPWLRDHGAGHGLDASRHALGGDSAGGNLAAVVALMARDAGWPAARLQLLLYPATDMRAVAPSHATRAQGYLLTADSLAYYRGHYTPDPATWSDWRASPLLASDLGRLPPALVLTAGFDPLCDEGRQYADALSAAGNRVQYVGFERQIHGFVPMSRVLDEALTAVDLCNAALRRALIA